MANDLPEQATTLDPQDSDSDGGGENHMNTSGDESSDDGGGNSYDENSEDSLDGTLDKCPICLRIFRQQEIGTPDTCEHCFCLKCILEWAENVTTCPIDRKVFHSVLILDKVRGQVVRVQELAPPVSQLHEDYDDFSDPTYCEICGCCDREDRLLLCDDCDDGYHLECLDPPLEAVPDADWWCTTCAAARARALNEVENSASDAPRRSRSRMPRTGLSRRIMQRRRRDTVNTDLQPCHAADETLLVTRRKRSASSAAPASRRPVSRGRRRTVQNRSNSGRRVRRGRKRRTRKRRVAMERKPATSRGRLIQQLGIQPPRPGQVYVGLPSCRPTHTTTVEPSTSSSAIRTQRHQAGIAPLRIYSTVNDLADYFEVSSDEEGSVGVMRVQPFLQRIGDSRKRILASAASQQSSSANILGPILSRQHLLLQDKNMQISSSDGRLVPSMSVDVDKLLLSPNHENDSSGYDSFGNRGSPPRIRRHGSARIFTTALTTNTGTNTSNSRETSRTSGDSSHSQSNSNPQGVSNSATDNLRVTSQGGALPVRGNSTPSCTMSSGMDHANAFEDFSGDDTLDKCAQRKKDNANESDKEEDEFNIYSDIEDDPRPVSRRNLDALVDAPESSSSVMDCGGTGEGESDDDMVIDEAGQGQGEGLRERERRQVDPSVSNFHSERLNPNQDVLSENGSDSLPGDVEPDSPLSIPLPDSTPPPSVRGGAPSLDGEDAHELSSSSDDAGKIDQGTGEDQVKDEYDPCHPLTSSDEDDEVATSAQRAKTDATLPAKVKLTDVQNSSAPLPSSEDSRRPAIQFSIPSRHRIFSMGSLIRRNKGVMKKQDKAGSSISFQSEMSKAFVNQAESDAGTTEAEGAEKVSLIAEIFGSDEEEEEEGATLTEAESRTPANTQSMTVPRASLPKLPEIVNEPPPIVESTTECLEGSKWRKIVEDEPAPMSALVTPCSAPLVAVGVSNSCPTLVNLEDDDDDDIVVLSETPPEVQIIETPPPEPEDEPSRSPASAAAEEMLKNSSNVSKIHEKGTKENTSPVSDGCDSLSDSENEFERQRLREKRMNAAAKKHDDEKRLARSNRSPKKDKSSRRTRKRSRSFSGGEINCEEGEILDIPDKKKKKTKKSKKSKKRRRSTRSRSSSSSDPVPFSEKKIPEDTLGSGQLSDEDEEHRKDVHWKKPSKSTKQRNYRDGKPKTEERYFREREKKVENDNTTSIGRDRDKSPLFMMQSTSLEDVRKDRSDRSRSKGERSGRRRSRGTRGKRTHSKHSNRSSSSVKNCRSRSRSVHSRSRHGRHHRDHSFSPGQWHESPNRADSRRVEYRSKSPNRRQHSPRSPNRRQHSPRSPNRRQHSPRSPNRRQHSPRSPNRRQHSPRSPNRRPRSTRRRSRSDGGGTRRLRRRSQSTSRSRSRSPSPRRKKGSSRSEMPFPKKPRKDVTTEKKSDETPEAVVAETKFPKSSESTDKAKAPTNTEKEKRRKRKRREKSISPAKAIFADGDSIVVSLNFQKGKSDSGQEKDAGEAKRSEVSDTKKSSRCQSKDKDKSSKAIKKTVLIDLESSPIQEQNIGISPTLIVLSDDEDHQNLKADDSDTDRLAVTTTSAGESAGKSPLYREQRDCHSVPADSTLHSEETKGSEFGHVRSEFAHDPGNTPADALVTSTRDSVDRNGVAPEEYPISPCTPPPKEQTPRSSVTPPLPPGTPPSIPPPSVKSPPEQQHQKSSTQLGSTPVPSSLLVSTAVATVGGPRPNVANPVVARPIGIGNIPGLFPSKMGTFPPGGVAGQLPIVIPTPPIPQLRLPTQNLFNQSVLATVANALYGPLMAAPQSRYGIVQQQQQGAGPIAGGNSSRMGPATVIGKKASGGGGSVLLPKDQNFSIPNQRRAEGGGDSPFSPNSSDGDDLFEPPKDPSHQVKNNASGGGGPAVAQARTDKGPGESQSHGPEAGGGNGKSKGRPAARIFDTLFGGPIRKPSSTTGNQSKSDGGVKSAKSLHKSKSRKGNHKKSAGNLSEGELRLTEEVPTSAVELRVKEKFLKKLNRQERVVEEVKVSLKPHYSKKHISKEEYKDILRRAVPKICHNKTGEINPIKIKELVEAYVKKIRKTKKK